MEKTNKAMIFYELVNYHNITARKRVNLNKQYYVRLT